MAADKLYRSVALLLIATSLVAVDAEPPRRVVLFSGAGDTGAALAAALPDAHALPELSRAALSVAAGPSGAQPPVLVINATGFEPWSLADALATMVAEGARLVVVGPVEPHGWMDTGAALEAHATITQPAWLGLSHADDALPVVSEAGWLGGWRVPRAIDARPLVLGQAADGSALAPVIVADHGDGQVALARLDLTTPGAAPVVQAVVRALQQAPTNQSRWSIDHDPALVPILRDWLAGRISVYPTSGRSTYRHQVLVRANGHADLAQAVTKIDARLQTGGTVVLNQVTLGELPLLAPLLAGPAVVEPLTMAPSAVAGGGWWLPEGLALPADPQRLELDRSLWREHVAPGLVWSRRVGAGLLVIDQSAWLGAGSDARVTDHLRSLQQLAGALGTDAVAPELGTAWVAASALAVAGEPVPQHSPDGLTGPGAVRWRVPITPGLTQRLVLTGSDLEAASVRVGDQSLALALGQERAQVRANGSSTTERFHTDLLPGGAELTDALITLPAGATLVTVALEPVAGVGQAEPIARWRFDEGAGDRVVSSTPDAAGGVIEGATWVAGQHGSALRFDGVDDRVVMTNAATADVIGDMTVACWVRIDDPNHAVYGRVLGKKWVWDRGQGYEVEIHPPSQRVNVTGAATGKDDQGPITVDLADGQWHHLVAIIQGTVLRLYVDGQLVGTDDNVAPAGLSALPLVIGASPAGRDFFAGEIDDVTIWNRAIDEIEIMAHGFGD